MTDTNPGPGGPPEATQLPAEPDREDRTDVERDAREGREGEEGAPDDGSGPQPPGSGYPPGEYPTEGTFGYPTGEEAEPKDEPEVDPEA